MDFPEFDGSELNNRSIVIFEYLYQGDELIEAHENINDENQTITFKVGSLTVDMPGNGGNGLSVKTGDNAPIFYAVGAMLMAVGAGGLVIVTRRGKKKSEKTE